MNQTLDEVVILHRFREVFPQADDYYQAVGFFRASGLDEAQAHTLAEEAVRRTL